MSSQTPNAVPTHAVLLRPCIVLCAVLNWVVSISLGFRSLMRCAQAPCSAGCALLSALHMTLLTPAEPTQMLLAAGNWRRWWIRCRRRGPAGRATPPAPTAAVAPCCCTGAARAWCCRPAVSHTTAPSCQPSSATSHEAVEADSTPAACAVQVHHSRVPAIVGPVVM